MGENPFVQIRDHILWKDEAVLLVNKPAGMLTIRDGYDPKLPYLAQILSLEFGKVWVVHRLDRETSGILIVARTAQAHQKLNTQFEHRQIKKIYHAIVIGVPEKDRFSVEVPLRVNGDRSHRTVADERNGKSAATDFIVLERYKSHSLIECHPATGYTHQIRAHLLAAGYPILCDPLYKLRSQYNPVPSLNEINLPNELFIRRLALHAYSITFTHPTTGQLFEKEAQYPDDFRNAIQTLRK
ncbi:MAG: RluA family pseudouridine synthase [Anaerolineaceae bacterium]|nr:RluA family pseudouridine synthase [Anaerolineaceae bacterium]